MNRHFPENAILVTMDVASLYTNIPIEDGLNSMKEAFQDFFSSGIFAETFVTSLRE